jgi:hypothetical protein
VTVTVTETPAPVQPSLADPLTLATAWSLCRTATIAATTDEYGTKTWDISPYAEGDVTTEDDGTFTVRLNGTPSSGLGNGGPFFCTASGTLGLAMVAVQGIVAGVD